MVRAHRLRQGSTFVGQECALCKQPFETGDAIVICPEDGSRHHHYCWQANSNRCTAYGCDGHGEIGGPPTRTPPESVPPPRRTSVSPNPGPPTTATGGSKVRVLPAVGGFMRSCLFILVVMALLAAGCFLLWAVTADAAQPSAVLPNVADRTLFATLRLHQTIAGALSATTQVQGFPL